MQLLELDRDDNILSQKKVSIRDIESLGNHQIVKVENEALNMKPFDEYHAFKKLSALKNSYSVKNLKEAIVSKREYDKAKDSKDWFQLKKCMYLEEIDAELKLIDLYKSLKDKDCGIVEFYCEDYEKNKSYRMILQDTNMGIQALTYINNYNAVYEADVKVKHGDYRETDNILVIDVVTKIREACIKEIE